MGQTLAILILFFSLSCLVHTYVLYPLLLKWLTRKKQPNDQVYPLSSKQHPHVFILMAVYNEEKVIATKIHSIFHHTTYPLDKIHLIIGSDNSNDQTHQIIQEAQLTYPNITLSIFEGRNGKIRIINKLFTTNKKQLQANASNIIIMTDANVFFTPPTIYLLSKHFKNPRIGLVAANIFNKGIRNTGISFQESWYIKRENDIKYLEGLLDGSMMGAFGACYAMRASLFSPVPNNFIVDDFYLTLKVLEQKHKAIKEPFAICEEDVSDDQMEEFRRKKRISAGNFQNLKHFSHLLHPSHKWIAFNFFSHKILRWFGPFLLIAAYLCNVIVCKENIFFSILLILQTLALLSPLFDYLLKKVPIHLPPLRFISYFYLMNLALLLGFFNFLKGIKTNVWKPTKRNINQVEHH